MGSKDNFFLEKFELILRDHSGKVKILKILLESGYLTVSGGQFHWGGDLLKSNGGVQRFLQAGRKSAEECKGKRELDCKTYKSSRDESRS